MQENKQEKSPIKCRILQYLENKGVTAYAFYKESGVTRGVLGQDTGISEDTLARFIAYARDVSPDWLLTGSGPMLRDEQPAQAPAAAPPTIIYERDPRDIELIATQKELISALKREKGSGSSGLGSAPTADYPSTLGTISPLE